MYVLNLELEVVSKQAVWSVKFPDMFIMSVNKYIQ